ncbi:MAG: hypothetical protein ABI622_01110 [Chloroflexota bacterium]
MRSAAHRLPSDLLIAAGIALRWKIRITICSFLATWIMVFVIGMAAALASALIDRLVMLPHVDWAPWINAPLAAITMGLRRVLGRALERATDGAWPPIGPSATPGWPSWRSECR